MDGERKPRTTDCECEGPGFCKRHGFHKTEHLFRLCQTNPRYFRRWENGRSLLQSRKPWGSGIVVTEDSTNGPGTILAEMLAKIGIQPTSKCNCKKYAAKMNSWGADKCEENIEDILDWMKRETKQRKFPFVRFAAKAMVKLAIRKSRKLELST